MVFKGFSLLHDTYAHVASLMTTVSPLPEGAPYFFFGGIDDQLLIFLKDNPLDRNEVGMGKVQGFRNQLDLLATPPEVDSI